MNGCSLRYVGDMPFSFISGTCDTFNIDEHPRILLCFSRGNSHIISIEPILDYEIRRCRWLTRKNNGMLGDIGKFNFDAEFELNLLPNSEYDHFLTRIGNYRGKFSIMLSRTGSHKNRNRLEIQ